MSPSVSRADYLRGRVLGRTEALIVYSDEELSDPQRGQRLLAVADRLAGDELAGFWRGANEIRPEALGPGDRARVRAGDFDSLPPTVGQLADRPSPRREGRLLRLGLVVCVGLGTALVLGVLVHWFIGG